ncbi:ABC transporter permease [Candidatus Saccharibacteria bacterium]|nr:ABC transporter permease [Candidatus Saccharibacteria bacterium]
MKIRFLNQKNRSLMREMVSADFKVRYQGSILGYAWSLLKPLFMFAILYIVFVKFLKIGSDIPHYPIYLLLGIVIWNFFGELTTQGLNSIVSHGDLIRKVKIPRWLIVASTSMSALINFGLNLIVIIVFMLINQVDLSWRLLLLPFNFAEVYLLGFGISLLLSAAYVKYRDLSSIWDIVLQAGFYVTPIFYPLSMITNDTVQKLLLLNPMAQAIQDARYNAVTTETVRLQDLVSGWKVLIPYIIVIFVVYFGARYFKKQSKYFAENL